MTKTNWRITGEEVDSCNCAWGCPCQFNALPTTGRCEALTAWRVDKGHFGGTTLDGVVFAAVFWWPGAVHEGDGKILLIVDKKAGSEQRNAIEALWTGEHGGAAFEIFSSVTPNKLGTISASIEFESDRAARVARIAIEGVGETRIGPIKNPVTGEEHRAQIHLPNGFDFKQAEMGNTEACVVSAAGVEFELKDSYAQLNRIEWSPATSA